MGRLRRSILGAIGGKVGEVIGGRWRGVDYIRALPIFENNDPTPKQLAQRARFTLVGQFFSSMTDLLSVSFQESAIRMSGYNSAVSYTLDNAVTGTYPNFKISYADVLVSQGRLKNGSTVAAAATVADTISYTWKDNSGRNKANATDKTILVVYCEDLNETEYKLGGALRTAGADTIDVTDFKGKIVQTWFAFISDDGSMVSDSFFTGQLTVL